MLLVKVFSAVLQAWVIGSLIRYGFNHEPSSVALVSETSHLPSDSAAAVGTTELPVDIHLPEIKLDTPPSPPPPPKEEEEKPIAVVAEEEEPKEPPEKRDDDEAISGSQQQFVEVAVPPPSPPPAVARHGAAWMDRVGFTEFADWLVADVLPESWAARFRSAVAFVWGNDDPHSIRVAVLIVVAAVGLLAFSLLAFAVVAIVDELVPSSSTGSRTEEGNDEDDEAIDDFIPDDAAITPVPPTPAAAAATEEASAKAAEAAPSSEAQPQQETPKVIVPPLVFNAEQEQMVLRGTMALTRQHIERGAALVKSMASRLGPDADESAQKWLADSQELLQRVLGDDTAASRNGTEVGGDVPRSPEEAPVPASPIRPNTTAAVAARTAFLSEQGTHTPPRKPSLDPAAYAGSQTSPTRKQKKKKNKKGKQPRVASSSVEQIEDDS